jgi:Zn-dependent protease with chaperone function
MENFQAAPQSHVVEVERWPTEIPLLVLVSLASIGIWIALAFSIIGIVYAILIATFVFVTHLGAVGHVRGSAVRIGPDQFPELHVRIDDLARRAGLEKTPAAYVMQAGGSLNAFATKWFRARMIVLFSDLEACGEDTNARDMIVGHELGHIRAGHLSWMWLIVPGMFVPFLGTAYSRARERTCDRYGAALCGDPRGAVRGLAILAAGASRGSQLNPNAFVRQREDLDTGWMTLARWLSGYPPLCERVAAVDPSLASPASSFRGPVRAMGILAVIAMVPLGLGVVAATKLAPFFRTAMQQAASQQATRSSAAGPLSAGGMNVAQIRLRVNEDFDRLAKVVDDARRAHGAFPQDDTALYKVWKELRPTEPPPMDPCDGNRYGYSLEDDGYYLWSAGPDGANNTDDDISLYMRPDKGAAGGKE